MRLSRQAARFVTRGEPSRAVRLTQRQFVVLALYVGGFTAQQTASFLSVELETISTYRKRVRAKVAAAGYSARSRTDLERCLAERGALVLRPDGSVSFVKSLAPTPLAKRRVRWGARRPQRHQAGGAGAGVLAAGTPTGGEPPGLRHAAVRTG